MQKKILVGFGDCNTNPGKLLNTKDYLIEKIANHLDCQTLNASAAMFTSREGLAKAKDLEIKPDYIMLNYGLVDAWVTSIPMVYFRYYPDTKLSKYFRKRLKTIKKRLRKLPLIPRGYVVSKAEYKRNIISIIEECKKRNPNVICLIWETPFVLNNQERNAHIDEYNAILKEIALERNLLFFPTRTFLKASEEYYLDTVHLSSKATDMLATEIAKTLLKAI